ncbi:anaerobic sulfite reductase subunit AsrB [Nanoarchaeota archaeon]
MNPYMPKLATIQLVTKENSDTNTYRVKYPIKHDPGQFVEVSIAGIGECPISICSSSKTHVELCIRNVGNTTNAISKLKKGDKLFIRGPYGHGYPMKQFKNKNIVIVGGGTGVAPIRGVIKYIEKNKKLFRQTSLFLGFRSPEDILFRKDLKEWKKKFNLHLTVDKADRKWKGNKGVVTKLLENAKISAKDTIAIACGPPIMIRFVIQTLKKLGFEDNQIYISFERLMKCGIGKCGRCQIGGKRVCKDGPVFCYEEAQHLKD